MGLRLVHSAFCLMLIFFAARVLSADEKSKLPVPPDAQLARTEAQIRELYKQQYNKPPAERRSFARELLAQAHNANSDPATRFVFYREARNVAAGIGDITAALRAIDELSQAFAIDLPEYKIATIIQTARFIDDQPKTIALLVAANSEIKELFASQNFAAIARLSSPITNAAAQSRNRFLMLGFRNRFSQLREAQIEFEKLSAAIAHPPLSDRNGDLAAGKVACFFKNDWQVGLGRMMNCTDVKIKDLAARDIATPTAPATQLALANSWWDLAQKQTGYAKTQFQARARYWYKKALPALAALDKPLAEKRILASVGAPSDARTFAGHAYVFDTIPMTWHEAVLSCELAGGHLVFVNSAEEDEFLVDLCNGQGSWLGATDEQEQGKWHWADGSPLEFHNWTPGEPNNARGVEHWARFERNGRWNDIEAGPFKGIGFICEWE